MCHRKIRNGQKFCDSCKQKRKNKADESYLDSLLNSVGVNVSPQSSKDTEDVFPDEDDIYQNPDIVSSSGESYQEQDNAFPEENIYQEQNNAFPEENIYQEQNNAFSEENAYQEQETNFENAGQDEGSVDDILSDILENMDENGTEEQQPETDIGEEDLENIFDEAEAYANLLNNDSNANGDVTEGSGLSDNIISGDFVDNMGTDSIPGENQPDFPVNELDSFFTEVGDNPEDGFSDSQQMNNPEFPFETPGNEGYSIPEDEVLNEVDKSLQGENTEQISMSQAFDNFDPIEESISVPQKKKKKKLSWFKKIFGNTNDEVTPEMIEADRLQKEEQKRLDEEKKEEKKKQNEEKKAEAEAEKARKKAEADAERNRKMALAAEKKAAAKEKARKKQETALAIAEYEMEHGKINKAGATILFVIFAVLTIVIIIGTNIYSYNLSIKNARENFEEKKYNEAYDDIYGYDEKILASDVKEDIVLYDRIMTVMYVNTQLNSYEYYMKSKNREKALDSLLKGLQRYDKYIDLARDPELNIEDDFKYVKSLILEKLDSEFGLSEEEAYSMASIQENLDYSEYLYGLLGSYTDELEKYK